MGLTSGANTTRCSHFPMSPFAVKKFVDKQMEAAKEWGEDLQNKINIFMEQQNMWEAAMQIGNFMNDAQVPEGAVCDQREKPSTSVSALWS